MALSGSASVVSSSSAVAETGACIPFSHHNNKHHFRPHPKVSFSVSPKPKLRLFAKTPSSRAVAVKAQLNQVSLGDLKNDAPKTEKKSSESKTDESPAVSSSAALASEESLSQFMNQVADLVKLVDSRDIVELKLKQLDCEIVIRKKEALPQTQAPVVMMHSPPPTMHSPPPTAAPSTPAPALPAQASAPPAAQQNKSSVPPLKSPIAGTFYRCPAPGAPPFVKVGDKVQKGQVVCIVEAMKLMNEIEADRSGTVVEIIAEDAKPVSVDTPLIMVQP